MAVDLNVIHHSEQTEGLYCDGKPCFEVWLRRKNRIEREVYYCCYARSEFDPHGFDEKSCPKSGVKPLYKPRFNWW